MDNSKVEKPNGGWGWMVVFGAFCMHFFNLGLVRMSGIMYLLFKERLESNARETATILSVFNSLRLLSAPAASVLCQKLGCRAVGMLGGVLLCVGLVLASTASNFLTVILPFGVISALGSGMCLTSTMIIIGNYFDKKKGRAMGIAVFGSGIGITAMSPLTKLMLDSYGYSGTLLLLGALMLQCTVGTALYRPLRMRPKAPDPQTPDDQKELASTYEEVDLSDSSSHQLDNSQEIASKRRKDSSDPMPSDRKRCDRTKLKTDYEFDISQKAESKTDVKTSDNCCTKISRRKMPTVFLKQIRLLLTNARFSCFGLVMVAYTLSFMGYLTFLPAFTEEITESDDKTALIVSIYGFADMFGCIVTSFVIDIHCVRHRRVLFVTFLCFLSGLTTLITPFMPDFYAVVISVVFNAVFKSGVMSQRITVASDLVSSSTLSLAVGFVLAFQGLGNVMGPPIEGLLRDTTGNYKACFYLEGTFLTAASVLFFLINTLSLRRKAQDDVIAVTEIEADV